MSIKKVRKSGNSWYRDQLLKNYNHLYKKDFNIDQTICRYCGSPFYCYDHRPAISQCPNINMADYLKEGGTFQLLPCCNECNGYLSNLYFIDVLDCLHFLMDKYREKIFRLPIWSETEIQEMRHSLRGKIILGQVKRNAIVDKIENIRTNINNY